MNPRFGEPGVGEPIAHGLVEACADLGPPGVREIIDDGQCQLRGLWKWGRGHGFSCAWIDRFAEPLERGLAGDAEHVADLLPGVAGGAGLMHGRGQQALGVLLDLARDTYRRKRILVGAENRRSDQLSESAMQQLGGGERRIGHLSIIY
ncbi:hypothetical protein [Mycolicibacterium neoaurum]|uniref:hypothetical protein n=1 Tax=Mycolicibacterium neoaurum TaxID=1795 RepID=UPI003D6CDD21